MAIKVKCNCGVRFQAKDQLAGKKVKCPKCSNPIRIPNPQAAAVTSSSSAPAPVSPLEDLLNEIGVSQNAPATGPLCPSCQSSIKANDILCVQCGYDLKTGQRLETVSYSEVDEMAGLSETEKLLAKAEKEIDDIPIASDEVDFGDGAGAYVVAAVVAVAAFIIIAITMTSTILLRMFGDNFVSVANTLEDEKLKDVEDVIKKYLDPFKPTGTKPKTAAQQARSDKQKAELNADIQALLSDDGAKDIIDGSVSKEEAQSKLKQFLSK